jgi:hypothetical protein
MQGNELIISALGIAKAEAAWNDDMTAEQAVDNLLNRLSSALKAVQPLFDPGVFLAAVDDEAGKAANYMMEGSDD